MEYEPMTSVIPMQCLPTKLTSQLEADHNVDSK